MSHPWDHTPAMPRRPRGPAAWINRLAGRTPLECENGWAWVPRSFLREVEIFRTIFGSVSLIAINKGKACIVDGRDDAAYLEAYSRVVA